MNTFKPTCIGGRVPLRMITNMKDEPQNSHIIYLPNKLGRILLISYEEVIGQAAVIAVQRMAGVQHLIGNLPPNNLARDFRFNDLGSIHETLERMYGPRAGRGIAMKTGQVCFKHVLREFGPSLGVSKLAYRLLPTSKKIEKGIQTFTDLYNRYSNQNSTFRVLSPLLGAKNGYSLLSVGHWSAPGVPFLGKWRKTLSGRRNELYRYWRYSLHLPNFSNAARLKSFPS